MSVSKLALYGIGTALFRIPRTRTVTVTTPPPFLFFKPIPLPFPRLHRRASSSSAAAEEETVSAIDQNHHPWPEWISFVDRLITKGYISKPSSSSGDGVYVNINLLKDACLSFARDRYDLYKFVFFSFASFDFNFSYLILFPYRIN